MTETERKNAHTTYDALIEGVENAWAKIVVALKQQVENELGLLFLCSESLYTGISINKLREMSNKHNCDYVFFVGTKRLFKRDALLRFIEEAYSV